MKAYLRTTGVLFGLMALLHVLKAADERGMRFAEPFHYWLMVSLGCLSAGLAGWAGWLLWRRPADRDSGCEG